MSFPLGIKRISLEKDNITILKKFRLQDIEYKEIAQRSANYGTWLEINKKNTVIFSKLD